MSDGAEVEVQWTGYKLLLSYWDAWGDRTGIDLTVNGAKELIEDLAETLRKAGKL